jgi:chemotaxis protein MotB
MADDHGHGHGEIIIIKKKGGHGHGHHGGAWKIAFADFMTAMFAFFLVLWIINASDKDTKTVIARYFNPVKLENPAKAKKGVMGTNSAPTEGKDEKADKTNGPPSKEKDPKGAPPPSGEKTKDKEAGPEKETKSPAEVKKEKADAQKAQAEAQLFSAPYEALDKIAGGATATAPGASAENGDADPQRLAGALSIDTFRDPFKPVGPGSPDDPVAFDADQRNKAANDIEPGKAGEADKPQPNSSPKARLASGEGAKPAAGEGAKPAAGGAQDEGKSGEGKGAESKGGGEVARLEKELKEKVEAAVKSGAGPAIEARQTKDGLLISLTDKLDFSMFEVGSATPRPELVRAMEAIAKIVREKPGPIVVRGHTDSRPYKNGNYDNWRLSSERAQMAYYMLTRGGAPAERFTRVEGYADRALRDPAHPLSAVNRRLEILLEGVKP